MHVKFCEQFADKIGCPNRIYENRLSIWSWSTRLQGKSVKFHVLSRSGNTRQQLPFSLLELWYSPLEFNSVKCANIKREGISAIKFEAAWIHFLKWRFRSRHRRRRCYLSSLWTPQGGTGIAWVFIKRGVRPTKMFLNVAEKRWGPMLVVHRF